MAAKSDREMVGEIMLKSMADPRYQPTRQTLSFYDQAVRESIAPRGMSEQERGAAFQDIAGITTGNIRNARRLGGGNISGQINAALNNANVIGATQYGRQDAMLRSQNRMNAYNRLGNVTNTLQGLQNNNTGLDVQKQMALGQGVRDARMQKEATIAQQQQTALNMMGMFAGMPPTGGMGGGPQKVGIQTGGPTAPQSPVESFQNTTYQQPTWFTPEQPPMTSPQYNQFTPYNFNPFSPAPPPRYGE